MLLCLACSAESAVPANDSTGERFFDEAPSGFPGLIFPMDMQGFEFFEDMILYILPFAYMMVKRDRR